LNRFAYVKNSQSRPRLNRVRVREQLGAMVYHHVATQAIKSRCTTKLDLLGNNLHSLRHTCPSLRSTSADTMDDQTPLSGSSLPAPLAQRPAAKKKPQVHLALRAGAGWSDQANAGPYVRISCPEPCLSEVAIRQRTTGPTAQCCCPVVRQSCLGDGGSQGCSKTFKE